ncbi:hypothetical protein MKW92_025792 [Papaver armeniacum]|nr:hypothetical protein MKW92_025792 [Papaver armeniacum]
MVRPRRSEMGSSLHSASVSNVRPVEFFKIFLSPKSFYKMKVQVEFLAQITREIPGIFSLCGPSGKVWRVHLLKMDDGYYFEEGWQDFVIDNYMSDGDFCVFKYVDKLCFLVQIFDGNSCEKESAFQANCSQPCTTNFSASHKGLKAVKNQSERLGGRFISQRRDITYEEEMMALDAAGEFVSKKPHTTITMRVFHVYTGFCLPLPSSFWKVHLPHCSQGMTLRDPRGKRWDVRFYVNQNRQIAQLTEGWRKISFTNNIEASDVCILELVTPKEFKLHIFRVVEEITPLRRERDIRNNADCKLL